MNNDTFLVITSIAAASNLVLKQYAFECHNRKIPFIVIGDVSSPNDFKLEGCDFLSIDDQCALDFETARQSPLRHYARKNIGYLQAIAQGAKIIIETDDDNLPFTSFWQLRNAHFDAVSCAENADWLNVFPYFTDTTPIWPRGFAADQFQKPTPPLSIFPKKSAIFCPIQQNMSDLNPDVDAIYRLSLPLPVSMRPVGQLALGRGTWCPFNSQNTTWFEDAFPLLYLPAYCSFRMTDIWRSFVTQRICWENDWFVLFQGANGWQERNEHNLLKDLEDETIGYLNNGKIVKKLAKLDLKGGKQHIFNNMITCYEAFIDSKLIDKKELTLLSAWADDFHKIKLQ